MKWDSKADQMLLKLIIEHGNFKVPYAAVAEHWPGEDKPTEKAIKHRITKIKTDTETKAESANDEEAKTAGTTKRKRKE